MTASDETLPPRNGGRRFEDPGTSTIMYVYGGLQTLAIILILWFGASVNDNGKAIAVVQAQLIPVIQTVSENQRRIRVLESLPPNNLGTPP